MKKMIVLILIIQSDVYWLLSGMVNEVRQTTHSEASVDEIQWKVSFEVDDEVKELLRQARELEVRT